MVGVVNRLEIMSLTLNHQEGGIFSLMINAKKEEVGNNFVVPDERLCR
jgi:hypothetical protein